jgi:CSLREA domain-containing protein
MQLFSDRTAKEEKEGVRKMTSTKTTTTKTNHYFRALVALAVLAMMAMLLTPRSALAFSTFTVNSTADTEDATPDGNCSSCTLREAIQEANANNNPTESDRINFNISGTGVHTISPASALPTISEPVIIDGYSQPGSSANTLAKATNAKLMIELDGTNAGSTTVGLDIGAQNSVVRGLVINRFARFGINFLGSASGSKSEGNFIGTDPTGTLDRGNGGIGLAISTSNVVIGGTTPDKRNLISGNQAPGVEMFGFGVEGNNKVQGNLIGTDKNGSANLGNGNAGVFILSGSNNVVGGGSTAAANTIAFNGAIGGAGGSDGVEVLNDNSTGNRILTNSIFSNEGLGVDLLGPNEDDLTNVSTPNDSGDIDTGPNGLQNTPSVGSAKTISGTTTIKGTLNSRPGVTYTIQFFSNPSGNEGKKFIGTKSISTDGSGHASFTFSPANAVSVGQRVTATATRNSTGDTSEFSAPRTVASS